MSPYQALKELFEEQGGDLYAGEEVTQLEHALQCAELARRDGAPPHLIVAALFHDVGHLLAAKKGVSLDNPEKDMQHEHWGYAWLARYFGARVTEPARLHVAAKRYLCATDVGYRSKLSEASIQSLHLQGGPMTVEEVAEFETNPFHADAVRLRRYDDEGKLVGWEVPAFESYRELIEAEALAPTEK